MLLLKGTLSGRDVGELIAQCHPLGKFRESTMRSIPAFENSPAGYAMLRGPGWQRHAPSSRRSFLGARRGDSSSNFELRRST